jgi:hypothetical protein
MTTSPMLAAALDYLTRGWPVFPTWWPTRCGPKEGPDCARCACGRGTCRSQGKHPLSKVVPNGLKDATTDPAVARDWWSRYPLAGVALVTGLAFDVLDVDDDQGLDVLDEVLPHGPTLDGRMALTGRGIHIYVEPTGAGNRSEMVRTDSGLDWRGRGGYVLAPPSMHYLGVAYEWPPDRGPDRPPAPCPPYLAALALTPDHAIAKATDLPVAGSADGPGHKAMERVIGRLALTAEGKRNETLYGIARFLGQLVAGAELDAATATAALVAVVERWDDLPKSLNTIERGLADGMRQGRRSA